MRSSILGHHGVESLIYSVVILAISLLILLIFRKITWRRMENWAHKNVQSLDDLIFSLIGKNIFFLLYFLVIYLAILPWQLSKDLDKWLHRIWIFVITVAVARIITQILSFTLGKYFLRVAGEEKLKKRGERGVLFLMKFLIWGLASIFVLDNMGFKISSVVTGLGIGGVAIALASQAFLADLFNYFAIIFDRPFEVGDYVVVGDLSGTIEDVGVKTTRIRSLSGEMISISNTDLMGTRIRNYRRMEERRVLFRLGVVYDTTVEQLKMIPNIVRTIIAKQERIRFDRCHFAAFGEYSLNIEVVYYVLSNDYQIYMEIQQAINLEIVERFKEEGIEFAFPTQKIYMSGEDSIRGA